RAASGVPTRAASSVRLDEVLDEELRLARLRRAFLVRLGLEALVTFALRALPLELVRLAAGRVGALGVGARRVEPLDPLGDAATPRVLRGPLLERPQHGAGGVVGSDPVARRDALERDRVVLGGELVPLRERLRPEA